MILKSVKIIEQTIQMTKFIIRMGGDEFLVILPNCTSELASACINNLIKAKSRCEDHTIPTQVFLFTIIKSHQTGAPYGAPVFCRADRVP